MNFFSKLFQRKAKNNASSDSAHINEARGAYQSPVITASPWSDRLDERAAIAVKEDISKVLQDNGKQLPTSEQWSLILCDNPATCVMAGAGSGKSTTLVLRVIVLHHYLNTPLNAMTIVTFTKASRKDFQRKLGEMLALWGISISPTGMNNLVRTFHSALLRMSGVQEQIFDFLGSNKQTKGGFDASDLLGRNTMSDHQRKYLEDAHNQLLADSDEYADIVDSLLGRADPQSDVSHAHFLRLKDKSGSNDKAFTQAVTEFWRENGLWPVRGIKEAVTPFKVDIKDEVLTFYANGIVEKTDERVVLGLQGIYQDGDNDDQTDAERRLVDVDDKPALRVSVKNKYLLPRTSSPVIFVRDVSAANKLVRSRRAHKQAGQSIPNVTLSGESETGLLEAMSGCATFMFSCNLDPATVDLSEEFEKNSVEQRVSRALHLFWGTFEELLKEKGLVLFDRVFMRFSEGSQNSDNFNEVNWDSLASLSTLMIDEFQDIAPIQAAWICGVFRELNKRLDQEVELAETDEKRREINRKRPNLMAVGDSKQSIYGWRGSSPHFFNQFETHFPSLEPCATLFMSTNFRSQQQIIDFAERLLVKFGREGDRSPPSVSGADLPPSPVTLAVPLSEEDEYVDVFEQILAKHPGKSVMVVARTNDGKRITREVTTSHECKVTSQTIHSSKGLEADVVVVVGDCDYERKSIFKNAVYRTANMPTTYDEAQTHEARRLAYVAITRGKENAYWIIDANPKGAIADVLELNEDDASKCWVRVRRGRPRPVEAP